MSHELWVPQHIRPAVQRTKIVFYKWKLVNETFRYTVGAPEEFPAPAGAEKIVCESAAEVDKYDKILRDQDAAEHEMSEEERYEREEPIWSALRADMYNRMVNARNDINREFCRLALAKIDDAREKRKEKRESFQHIVGFEQGH